MKKKILLTTVFLIFATILWAQEETTDTTPPAEFTFYLELNSSYKKQSFDFYLLESPQRVNSLLEWQADYLFTEGVTGGMQIDNFECVLSCQFCLPFECGKMYDSDWRTQGIKTNYSISDLFCASGCDSKLFVKYNFTPGNFKDKLYLSPVLGVSNSFIDYEGKNTIGWCGDTNHTHLGQDYAWNSEYAKKYRKYGINLTNNITSVFCGLEATKYFGPFYVNAGALLAPFTYIFSIDHHLNSGEGHYYQAVQKSYFTVWDFYLNTSYSINKNNAIILSADYSFCPKTDGDFNYGYYKTGTVPSDSMTQFAFKKFLLSLSWRFTFSK